MPNGRGLRGVRAAVLDRSGVIPAFPFRLVPTARLGSLAPDQPKRVASPRELLTELEKLPAYESCYRKVESCFGAGVADRPELLAAESC